MVRQAICSRRHGAIEHECAEFELIDEHFNDPDWVVLDNEIVEVFWKQRSLLAIFAFYESLRLQPALNAFVQFRRSGRFHTASVAFQAPPTRYRRQTQR
jgi:hypothetical protein